MITPLVS